MAEENLFEGGGEVVSCSGGDARVVPSDHASTGHKYSMFGVISPDVGGSLSYVAWGASVNTYSDSFFEFFVGYDAWFSTGYRR